MSSTSSFSYCFDTLSSRVFRFFLQPNSFLFLWSTITPQSDLASWILSIHGQKILPGHQPDFLMALAFEVSNIKVNVSGTSSLKFSMSLIRNWKADSNFEEYIHCSFIGIVQSLHFYGGDWWSSPCMNIEIAHSATIDYIVPTNIGKESHWCSMTYFYIMLTCCGDVDPLVAAPSLHDWQ